MSEGSLYSTPSITHKRKKKNNLKQEKQCIYFRDNGENKDKLTAAGEYHSGSGCKEPGAKYMELLKEN